MIVAKGVRRSLLTLMCAPLSACNRLMFAPCGPIRRGTLAASQVSTTVGGFTMASTARTVAATVAASLPVMLTLAKDLAASDTTLIFAPVSACKRFIVASCGSMSSLTRAASHVGQAFADLSRRES